MRLPGVKGETVVMRESWSRLRARQDCFFLCMKLESMSPRLSGRGRKQPNPGNEAAEELPHRRGGVFALSSTAFYLLSFHAICLSRSQ
jgi:hypothetical protein